MYGILDIETAYVRKVGHLHGCNGVMLSIIKKISTVIKQKPLKLHP